MKKVQIADCGLQNQEGASTAASAANLHSAICNLQSPEKLPRFHAFLTRLETLPERVGPIDLRALRDTSLPLPETWSAAPPGERADRPPLRPEAGWLAGALAAGSPGDHPAAALLRVARRVRPLPAWTLTTMWLLEAALAWPEAPGPHLEALLRGELGDLYCQTGNIVQGLELLDSVPPGPGVEGLLAALRAARWVELLHGGVAAERLEKLCRPDVPDVVHVQAELELLGLDAVGAGRPGADLLERARRVEDLVARAAALPLSAAERHGLRVRALQVVARWFGGSRVRPIREAGRERLQEAVRQCREVGDWLALPRLLEMLGRAHLRLGSMVRAREAFEESIALGQQLRDLWGLGGSLTSMAECLLAAGQGQESLPYFQVNLLLLDRLGGMEVLFVRNLARHLNALVASGCNPLESAPPPIEVLELAGQLRHEFTAVLPSPQEDPFWLLIDGSYHRLAARRAAAERPKDEGQRTKGPSPPEGSSLALRPLSVVEENWQEHLRIGLVQVQRSGELFRARGLLANAAEADRAVAALLLDRVGLHRLHGTGQLLASAEDLDRARQALEEADRQAQGEHARVQAELLWARYHQLAGAPYQMQLHLAAARRAAEASGFRALAVEVDARLGVRLTGPGGNDSVVVALPGETVPLEVRASDWRGRPLPGYVLHGFVEARAGPCPGVVPAQQTTDHLGRARFELLAGKAGRAVFHAATPDGVHTTAVRIVVRPVALEWTVEAKAEGRRTKDEPGGAAGSLQQSSFILHPSEERLLRQLFGPGCPRLRIQREFTSGRSGTRVLLVEPFRDGEQDEELRGQPCIVKLGPRPLLEDELDRYQRWVKGLLPVNASRLDGFAAWHDEASLRQSLVGDLARGQVREACEWLATADAFDAHVLLERVFVGDLAACWYANNPRRRGPLPLAELYGPMTPVLLYLDDETPPRGLTAGARPGEGEDVRVADGLRPPAARSFRPGDEVCLGGAGVLGFRQADGKWAYELAAGQGPLRVSFTSLLPPELVEPDGAPERLLSSGRAWSVRGRVRATAFDRLHDALRRCCDVFNASHPGESANLLPDERQLAFSTERAFCRRSNPLLRLHWLVEQEVSCSWSLIHGDLHGRNVLVGAQGQPFYIDFARTGYGPTLFDFIKFEVYLWHENFAGWPAGHGPAGRGLAEAIELLDELASPDPARHFPSPYARREAHARAGWPGLFRQCLATLRSAARPYVVDPAGRDYFLPLALYTALMLRWCDPETARDEEQRRVLARQGVLHALAAGALLDGVLAGTGRERVV